MLRLVAILFGIGFVFIGIASFLPNFMHSGLLFGYFETSGLHSIICMITGVLAIMAATSFRYTKLYFKIFGIIYTVAAIVGFWRSGNLYVIQVNTADNIFHLVIGVISLYLGFSRI